jgi:hypothetical protein
MILVSLNLGILIALIVTARNPRRFLWIVGFVLPLQAVGFEVGVGVAWYKVILFVVALIVFVRRTPIRRPGVEGSRNLLIFLAYAFIVTCVGWAVDTGTGFIDDATMLGWGAAQTVWRYPVQFFTFIATWGLWFVVPMLASRADEAYSAIKGLISGSLVSVIAGFYQVVASVIGLPLFNIADNPFLSGELDLRAVWEVPGIGLRLPRLYGLGGEPKHTAAFTVVALIALLMIIVDRAHLPRRAIVAAILMTVATIFTASSGGLVGLTLAVAYFAVVRVMRHPARGLLSYAVVLLSVALALGAAGRELAAIVFEQRVASRLESFSAFERFEPKDAAAIEYLIDHPTRGLFGHGVGGIDFRLIPLVSATFLSYGGTLTPAYLATRLLGDVGIVGVALVILAIAKWRHAAARRGDFGSSHFIVAGAIALLFVTQVGVASYVFLAGAMLKRGALEWSSAGQPQ